mgnify:CR=1 FL=1
MITRINSKMDLKHLEVGNKALNLNIMAQNDINVPDGLILNSEEYKKFIKRNKLANKIKEELGKLNKYNTSEISHSIEILLDSTSLDKEVLDEIEAQLNLREQPKTKTYSVRSSASKEDLDNLSFAGQYKTTLYVKSHKLCIEKAIIDCYKSLFSETSLSYIINNDIEYDELSMSVIIQDMIDAEYSGICFTANPLSGKDTEMVIEIAYGIGENIVSGRVTPQQYYYDWYKEKVKSPKESGKAHIDSIQTYGKKLLEVQKLCGYPCDIEFAIKDNELYILQAREITKFNYTAYKDIWTTADFRDGISATVCTPFMWSLYEYIWEYTLRKFLIDSKILSEKEIKGKKLGEMYFGRCYWNLSIVKQAMSKVIGYKEREFDNDYGITPTYEGDGQTTRINLKSLNKIVEIAIAQNKILKERDKNHIKYREDLLKLYKKYKYRYDTNTITDVTTAWTRLIKRDYLKSESTYFWQIFINTIHQSLYKNTMLKYVTPSEYLKLLGTMDNISHLLPFYNIWNLSRQIRKDTDAYNYWKDNSVEQIKNDINNRISKYYTWDVEKIIKVFGYHSDKELDVTYPCYYEDISTIIKTIKDTVILDDSFSPYKDTTQGTKEYNQVLNKLEANLGKKKLKKLEYKILKMREMLWWREEYRDISTRFYYLIRVYTIKLAEKLLNQGIINEIDDIWYLKIQDILDWLSGLVTDEAIKQTIIKNREYYQAFRNYTSDNEIGGTRTESIKNKGLKGNTIKGLGANSGVITGTARVIKGFNEINRIQPGDILVTKFTDTGWTPKFATISGIITEYSGILCHAAIVAREYNIPAVVNCTGVMNKIKDGDNITVNGETGEVIINKK